MYFSSFICLVNHFFISVWTRSYLFYDTLHYNPFLLYYVAQITLVFTIGSSFCQLLCPVDIPNHCGFLKCFVWFCFVLLSAFLFSGTTSWSRLLLHISCPSPRISHFCNDSSFLSLKNSMSNQDLFFALSTDRPRKYICAPVIVCY